MKIVVASDIHGSAYYCREVINAFEKEEADKLLLLGDLLYHGPRNDFPKDYDTKACTAMLNARKQDIMAVRGNCDAEVDQMVLEFPIMADYCILYAGGRMIFATHGHLFNTEHMPMLQPGDILLHGHTHVQVCEPVGDNYYINPGSASLPKDGSKHAYMVITDESIVWKTFEGEIINEMQL